MEQTNDNMIDFEPGFEPNDDFNYGLDDNDYMDLMRERTNLPSLIRDICDNYPEVPRVPMEYVWEWMIENNFVYEDGGCYYPTERGELWGMFVVEITGFYRYHTFINDHIPWEHYENYPVIVIEYGGQFSFIDLYLREIVRDWESRYNKKAKSIKCVETDKVYSSICEAAKQVAGTSKKSGNISIVINNPNRTAYGYHWIDY